MDLNDKEKEAWDKQGWTPEGVAHVSAKDLAESLGVPIGRAASIIAQCKRGAPATDEVERALGGDVEARSAVSRMVRGLPWVALRNGKPDLAETRALVKDLKERPAPRASWKGLLVVQPSAIPSAANKLPRCQITGNVLDDYDGKLVDAVTGADWSPIWVERGNGRILWLAHGPRSLLPAYAATDPARAAKELAESEVPVQWRRLEASFLQASATEKAVAADRLFTDPAAEAFAQPAGRSNLAPAPAEDADHGIPLCVLYAPSDHRHFDTLRIHLTPQIRQGVYRLVEEVSQAKVVIVLVSSAMIADELIYRQSEEAARSDARLVPVLVRAVSGFPPHFANKRSLPDGGKPASSDADWADIARALRLIAEKTAPMSRATIRKRLEYMPDSEFMALCLDYFPDAHREFSGGMIKTEKINLLLQLVTPDKIARVLR